MNNTQVFRDNVAGVSFLANNPGILTPDRPIAFNRDLVGLGIKVNGALFLSQALYWSRRTKDPDGWFYKTIEEWEEETGLTREEQSTVKNRLQEIGVLTIEKRGLPARNYFLVNKDELALQLVACNRNKWGGFPATGGGLSPQHSNTETTTEIPASEKIGIFPSQFPEDNEEDEETTVVACDDEGNPLTYNGLSRQKGTPRRDSAYKAREEMIRVVEKEFGKKFLARAKQHSAIKTMLALGVTTEEMTEAIYKLIEKPFYKESGWDFHSVLSEISKK